MTERGRSQAPLVVVEGFCCATNSLVWGDYRSWIDRGEQTWRDGASAAVPSSRDSLDTDCADVIDYAPRRVLLAPIGPVSSLHDRACELFYALKGGRIDYGEEHAASHGHARYGREYACGLWEQWSPEHPAHFFGHSLGGTTIVKLHQLLRQGFFDSMLGNCGREEADKMVRSVTTVSSPFRGTQLVYTLGEKPTATPGVRFLSVGDVLAKAVHLAAYLNIGPDLLSDAWPFSRRHSGETPWQGLRGLLSQWRRSEWAEGADSAPWDCTLAARAAAEKDPDWGLGKRGVTWYRSYAAYMTSLAPAETPSPKQADEEKGKPAPSLPFHVPAVGNTFLSPLTHTARIMGRFDFDQLSPRPHWWRPDGSSSDGDKSSAFSSDPPLEAWFANDGVVPLASQFHPGDCQPGVICTHSAGMPGPTPTELLVAARGLPLARKPTTMQRTGSGAACPRIWERPVLANVANRTVGITVDPVDDPAFFPSSPPRSAELLSRVNDRDVNEGRMRTVSANVPEPDKWQVHVLPETSHTALCPLWTGTERQRMFWAGIGRWLAEVDLAAVGVDVI